MVLVYDDDKSEIGNTIRDELLRRLIPCAVSRDRELVKFALAVVSYMDAAGDEDFAPLDSDCILLADREALCDPKQKHGELRRVISRIEDVFLLKYGFDPYTVVKGAVFDSLECSRYIGRRFYLPTIEKLIIRVLALSRENYVNAATIHKFCLRSDVKVSTVTVHINKMNLRAYMCSPIKLISSKRLRGYYITKG